MMKELRACTTPFFCFTTPSLSLFSLSLTTPTCLVCTKQQQNDQQNKGARIHFRVLLLKQSFTRGAVAAEKKNCIFTFLLFFFPTSPSCFSCSFFALAEEVLCIIHCARLSPKSFFFRFLIVAQELLYPHSHSLRVRHTGSVFLIIFLVHSKTYLLLFRFLLFRSRLSLFFFFCSLVFFFYNGQYISLS